MKRRGEKRPKNRKRIVAIVVGAAIALVALLLMLPFIRWLARPDTQQAIQSFVAGLGWLGVLAALGLQMLQVIVSVIPGEPFELMAGVLYGGLGGLVICVAGCFLGTLIAFQLSRRFGKKLLYRLSGKKSLEEFGFLRDPKRQQTAAFVLFLIPGIPKDILTYIAGTGPMKPLAFTCIATFARIPAIASSTFIGTSLLSGNWVVVIVLFVVTAGVGLLGIHYRERIVAWARRLGEKRRGPAERPQK